MKNRQLSMQYLHRLENYKMPSMSNLLRSTRGNIINSVQSINHQLGEMSAAGLRSAPRPHGYAQTGAYGR